MHILHSKLQLPLLLEILLSVCFCTDVNIITSLTESQFNSSPHQSKISSVIGGWLIIINNTNLDVTATMFSRWYNICHCLITFNTVLVFTLCSTLFYTIIVVCLVFYCYQEVYDIFNMSCLGVILQVRGCDGMSTLQNGVAAYSQSHTSRICQGGFLLPSMWLSSP